MTHRFHSNICDSNLCQEKIFIQLYCDPNKLAASLISAISVEYLPRPTQSNTFYHLPQNDCLDKEDVVKKQNFFTMFGCSFIRT